MRFAQTACKFEGLHFSHRFFYDLMYLLVAMSVNVAGEEIKKRYEKDLKTYHSSIQREALQIVSPTNGGPDSAKKSSHLLFMVL